MEIIRGNLALPLKCPRRQFFLHAVSATEQHIVLVTPVWNDSARLEVFGPRLARALLDSDLSVRWIVADDGSSAAEKARVTSLVEGFTQIYPAVEAMLFSERCRKGGAVYRAWDACPQADLLAFVDADGAVSAASVVRLLRHACDLGVNAGVVGVRHDAVDTPVRRPWMRALSFRLFASLVHGLVGIDFEDTQCGAKVIPAAAYRAVSTRLIERGFVFDVELLVALEAQGSRIEQLRIPWREMPGGKVNPLRDAWGMIAGILRIRKRVKAGAYRRQDS